MTDYARFHGNRTNLILHLVTVPVFLAGSVAVALAWLAPWLALAGLGAMGIAIAVQGRGHAGEATPPRPFAGPGDFLRRIMREQWVTFPRFVLSGELARTWRR